MSNPQRLLRPLRIVALVGIDGSGKTTQAQRIAAALTGAGSSARYALNAGGRRWFSRLAQRLGPSHPQRLLGVGGLLVVESILRWLAIAWALLRARLRHQVAVMDRYSVCQYASIRAHRVQGVGQGTTECVTRWVYRIFPRPDITFLLAVEPTEAYRRIEARGTDHETLPFLIAATQAYRELPEAKYFVVIDADRDPDQVTDAILAAVGELLTNAECIPSVPRAEVEARKRS
ncbi:MAG: dTMP kinase [Gammaproteobacteria bacterium]